MFGLSVWKFLTQHQPLPGWQIYVSWYVPYFHWLHNVEGVGIYFWELFADAWRDKLTEVHPFWITEFLIATRLHGKTIWTTAQRYLEKFTLKFDGKKLDLYLDWILLASFGSVSGEYISTTCHSLWRFYHQQHQTDHDCYYFGCPVFIETLLLYPLNRRKH